MKYLIISLLLCCACSTPPHRENFLLHAKNDWKEDELRGKPRKVVENEYENGKWTSILTCEYNEMGFLTRKDRIRIQSSGNIDTSLCRYEYDTINGIKTINESYDGYKQTPNQFWYNTKGLLIRDTSFERSNRYRYDAQNRLVEEIFSSSGKDVRRTVYDYYPDGKVKKGEYDLGGEGKKSESITTDSTEIHLSFHKGDTIAKVFYQKDKFGNIIFSTNDIAWGCLTRADYIKYYYNANNELVKEEYVSSFGSPKIIIHDNHNDKAGNWLTKEYDEKKLIRTITYWE
ncbi:YD repeat-containing protein [Chitinophaga dinghuensis]|uniref:YD repeat-containing protein n=1 Tax=Chitinophaga dinghuensis TaxID=1539050 RepID=A0A327W1V0_9BACT|nr:hypothetical protein [Chitinophaga dinghuensis]RAJ83209.1 YD repeat-containing protein [Chitinophaga dinghuensis]